MRSFQIFFIITVHFMPGSSGLVMQGSVKKVGFKFREFGSCCIPSQVAELLIMYFGAGNHWVAIFDLSDCLLYVRFCSTNRHDSTNLWLCRESDQDVHQGLPGQILQCVNSVKSWFQFLYPFSWHKWQWKESIRGFMLMGNGSHSFFCDQSCVTSCILSCGNV